MALLLNIQASGLPALTCKPRSYLRITNMVIITSHVRPRGCWSRRNQDGKDDLLLNIITWMNSRREKHIFTWPLKLISLPGPQPCASCTSLHMKRGEASASEVNGAIPLSPSEGAPGPSGNSGWQGGSAPAGESRGPYCRRTPGKAHADWGSD